MIDQIIQVKNVNIGLFIRCQRSNGSTYTHTVDKQIDLENKNKSNFGMMHFAMTDKFYDAVGNYLKQH